MLRSDAARLLEGRQPLPLEKGRLVSDQGVPGICGQLAHAVQQLDLEFRAHALSLGAWCGMQRALRGRWLARRPGWSAIAILGAC